MATRSPENPGAGFTEKTYFFLKFIGLVTPLWVLYPSEIKHIGSTRPLIARALFARSIKVLGLQPGAPNPGSTIFRKKPPESLKFFGPVTPLWVLYPSKIMYMGSTGSLLVRAAFAKSIKVLGLQPGAPKPREHDFPKKPPDFLKFFGPVTHLWVLLAL